MSFSATRKYIGNINVKKSLVVIVLLSFLVICSCKKNLRTHEIKRVTNKQTVVPKQTSIIRKKYTPRVVVVVVQTHATEGWCRLMLSAIMNKIEIVTIALGALYGHEKRPGWIMEYIESEMLRDEDIIISVDGSDTIVTERENFDRSVQYFTDNSAPYELSFTTDDVIKGIQISPMIFLADPHCYAPQLDIVIDSAHKEHEARCHWFYNYAYDLVKKQSLMNLIKNSEDGHNFLSAGAFISRVWAFRKAHNAYKSVLSTSNKWWCDQSIWVLVFIWSVTQTNVSNDLRALTAGLMTLDYDSKFFHYPFYVANSKASFLHFTGDPIHWRTRTPGIISQMGWYRNLSRESKLNKLFRKQVLETKMNFCTLNEDIQTTTFSAICGDGMIDDANNFFLSEK